MFWIKEVVQFIGYPLLKNKKLLLREISPNNRKMSSFNFDCKKEASQTYIMKIIWSYFINFRDVEIKIVDTKSKHFSIVFLPEHLRLHPFH